MAEGEWCSLSEGSRIQISLLLYPSLTSENIWITPGTRPIKPDKESLSSVAMAAQVDPLVTREGKECESCPVPSSSSLYCPQSETTALSPSSRNKPMPAHHYPSDRNWASMGNNFNNSWYLIQYFKNVIWCLNLWGIQNKTKSSRKMFYHFIPS